MKSKTETQAETPGRATVQEPKATKRAKVAPQARHVAPGKGKSGKKASQAKKAPKGAKAAKPAKDAGGAREGGKTAKILGLLKRPNGVTAKELQAYASHCTSLA